MKHYLFFSGEKPRIIGHRGAMEEPSRIAVSSATLRTGHVVTVEPGLYYLGMGGVRLEDVVVVTPNGNRNLTRYPQFLEI